jgi:xanthine/uracil/vitamin C permease (AzgA family)
VKIALFDFTHFELGNEACQAIVCIFSFLVIAVLQYNDVKGAIFFEILAGTVLGISLKASDYNVFKR